MPYASDAQRRFFHANEGKKKGITKKVVEEYDQASKGKDLPERVKDQKHRHPQLPAGRMR
jgi:hypothetical protein